MADEKISEEKDRKTLEQRHQMSDLERLRHSCAHVLATAVSRIWPDAHAERDVESIFKVDLLNDIPEDEEISIYKNGDFWDLCAGPHVGRTGNCKAFKIMSVASAFYKGDANKQSLQRIYGTCFKNKTMLDEHLERLEEAKKRDHRRLGKEMNLFTFDESVGQGLPLWKPKGGIIRRELQDFITEHLDKQGYYQVFTPHIGKLDLYRTSGHFPYYEDSQFPPIVERDAIQQLANDNAKCADLDSRLSWTREKGPQYAWDDGLWSALVTSTWGGLH